MIAMRIDIPDGCFVAGRLGYFRPQQAIIR